MKKYIKTLSLLAILTVMLTCLFSCSGKEAKATLSLLNGTQDGDVHSIYVPSSAETIDLEDYIVIPEDAECTLYSSSDMKKDSKIDSIVALQTGENLFYAKVKEGTVKREFTIKIIRKKAVTLTFDTLGGSACSSIVTDEGTIVSAPETTKAGYTFAGWSYDFSNPVTEDITVSASWEAKKFNLTLNAEGEEPDVKEIAFGSEYSISAPLKTGYKFVKWIDSKGRDFPASGIWNKVEDVSLSAVYVLESYKLSYIYNADIENKTLSFTINDTVSLETPTHPDGYEFVGWYFDAELTNKADDVLTSAAKNITLYAKWNPRINEEEPVYTITVDADGFDIDGREIEVKYGGAYTLPQIPERAGYEFVAWISNGAVIPTSGIWNSREDAIVTIKWNALSYSIEYNCDSKTENPNTVIEYTTDSDTITLLPATRPNAVFVGWYTDASCAEEFKISEIAKGSHENLELYAKFDISVYTITYNANGGTVLADNNSYEKGDPFTLLTPEYPAYKFLGWYYEDTLIQSGEWNFDENITLVAKWEALPYLLTFELLGGTTSETLKTIYTVEDTYTLPKPTKSGYYFLGWSEGDSKNVYSDVTIQKGTYGNKKFVANWSEFSYSYSDESAIVTGYVFNNSRSSVKIPTTVNYNGVDYTVTEIGPSVFEGMGKRIANKEIVVNGSVASQFTVEIPKTLKAIKTNAFSYCDDVSIKVAFGDEQELVAWADSLSISEGNDHVRDVIKGLRPAIGWSIYG